MHLSDKVPLKLDLKIAETDFHIPDFHQARGVVVLQKRVVGERKCKTVNYK